MENGAHTQNGVNGERVLLPVERDLKREHARDHVIIQHQGMVGNYAAEVL